MDHRLLIDCDITLTTIACSATSDSYVLSKMDKNANLKKKCNQTIFKLHSYAYTLFHLKTTEHISQQVGVSYE